MMRRTVLAVVALLWVIAVPAVSEEIDKDLSRSFDVEPGATLHLDHGDGDVEITPWEKPVITVEVRYRADLKSVGWHKQTEFDVEFLQRGNDVYVTGKEPHSAGIGFFSSREYEYTYSVQAPSWMELDLEGEDGDVEIEAWRASLELDLEDGDLVLRDFRADADLSLEDGDARLDGFAGELTMSAEDGDLDIYDCAVSRARIRLDDGDLSLDGCEGDFEIRAEDGEVRASRLRTVRLEVITDDGDIDLELLAAPALDLTVRTQDGRVALLLDPALSAAFNVDTDDGRVRIDHPDAADIDRGEHRVSGRIRDGAGTIRVTTGDGSVSLRSKGGRGGV